MERCSDPLCCAAIDPSRSPVKVEGRVYCAISCRKSWEMANTALQGAANPFRFSPMAIKYSMPMGETVSTP